MPMPPKPILLTMPSLSKSFQIVLPVYNEECTLETSVLNLLRFLKENNYHRFSILIADNASTDKTAAMGKMLSKRHMHISYLHIDRKGVGIALKSAWKLSRYDI